jgi:transcriptional regulator with XRE-family HTH domain
MTPLMGSLTSVFAERLLALRQGRGMTQTVLAKRAGTSVEYISRLERCRLSPTLDGVEKIASGLGVEPVQLVTTHTTRRAPSAEAALGQIQEVLASFRKRGRGRR